MAAVDRALAKDRPGVSRPCRDGGGADRPAAHDGGALGGEHRASWRPRRAGVGADSRGSVGQAGLAATAAARRRAALRPGRRVASPMPSIALSATAVAPSQPGQATVPVVATRGKGPWLSWPGPRWCWSRRHRRPVAAGAAGRAGRQANRADREAVGRVPPSRRWSPSTASPAVTLPPPEPLPTADKLDQPDEKPRDQRRGRRRCPRGSAQLDPARRPRRRRARAPRPRTGRGDSPRAPQPLREEDARARRDPHARLLLQRDLGGAKAELAHVAPAEPRSRPACLRAAGWSCRPRAVARAT